MFVFNRRREHGDRTGVSWLDGKPPLRGVYLRQRSDRVAQPPDLDS
jgi:hypothetical protein